MSTFIPCLILTSLCGAGDSALLMDERIVLDSQEPRLLMVAEAAPVEETQTVVTDEKPLSEPTPESAGPVSKPGDEIASDESGGGVSEEARPLVEKVQSFYEDIDDFTASFAQTYTYEVGRQVRSSGTVAFKKPAMMRWDYENPRERSFIVDGEDLWIWTPEDYSVVRQRDFTGDQLSTSITFLWGKGRLEDEFHIELEEEDTLALTPIRPDGGFQSVIFKVHAETGRVLESTVVDSQGNRNHMVFSAAEVNSGLDGDRFAFTPPEGADIQEMPSSW